MKKIEVHLTPENFPRTEAALKELFAAIATETLAYCESHGHPMEVSLAIANALLYTAKNEIEAQMAAFKNAPECDQTHLFKPTEDSDFTPFATGAQFKPIHNPNNN